MKIKRFIILVFILFIIFRYSNSQSLEISSGFNENVLLSTIDTLYPHHVEPTLVVSENGTLFAGWKNAYGDNTGGVRVSFSKSVDGGKTWSTPFDMPLFNSSIQTGQSDPWMVWFNETLYYAYLEFDLNDPFGKLDRSQVTLAQSPDYGKTWTLTRASNNSYFADKETMIIASDGTIYIAYDDATQNDYITKEVRLSMSTDGGQTFNDSLVINDYNDAIYDQLSPYLMINSMDELLVTWIKFTSDQYRGYIAFDKLINGSFGIDQNITVGNDTGLIGSKWCPPSIKVDSHDRLYILWADISEPLETWDVYLRWSDDNGETWSEKIRVNSNTNGQQWMADMDIDKDDNLHIVYYDEQGSSFKPVYQVIFVEGNEMNITNPRDVSTESTSSGFSRPGDYFTIQVDSNLIVHVVWSDGRNNEMDIYYAQCDCLSQESTIINTSTSNFGSTSENSSSVQTGLETYIFISSLIFITMIRKRRRNLKYI